MERLRGSALSDETRNAHVFARIKPGQKLRVVRALQDGGMVIAMVGDGINDSPALRAAHVGVAMGMNGDAAAREVADLFLHTEDLGRFSHAVEQGRTTHANIRKSLRFILSTNSSEVLLMLAVGAFGLGEGHNLMGETSPKLHRHHPPKTQLQNMPFARLRSALPRTRSRLG